MATIQCDIVSAEGSIFSGAVDMLIATGEFGELGVGTVVRFTTHEAARKARLAAPRPWWESFRGSPRAMSRTLGTWAHALRWREAA